MSAVIVTSQLSGALRLTVQHEDGVDHVTLEPGRNQIEADFWRTWSSENADYAPVLAGLIAGPSADEPAPEAPAVEPEAAPVAAEPEPEPEPEAPPVHTPIFAENP